MSELKGFRIWEINDITRIPKTIKEGDIQDFSMEGLDLENKTYAIRIGKSGLR
jgi:hypothetical protein